jgi:hypothetical protein
MSACQNLRDSVPAKALEHGLEPEEVVARVYGGRSRSGGDLCRQGGGWSHGHRFPHYRRRTSCGRADADFILNNCTDVGAAHDCERLTLILNGTLVGN